MPEPERASLLRGCLTFPLALLIYLTTLLGSQIAFGIGGILAYGLLLGLPVLFIAVFTVAGVLSMRDRLPPVPAATSLPLALVTSVVGTIALHLQLLIRLDLTKSLLISGLIGLSSLLAGLSTFGYAEVLRDQFPPNGGRRSDTP